MRPIVLQFPLNVGQLRVELILLGILCRIQIFVCHTLSINAHAYLRGGRQGTKKHGTLQIHALKALRMPANPDKSRPCLTHRRLRLILRVGLYEFLRFLELSE